MVLFRSWVRRGRDRERASEWVFPLPDEEGNFTPLRKPARSLWPRLRALLWRVGRLLWSAGRLLWRAVRLLLWRAGRLL